MVKQRLATSIYASVLFTILGAIAWGSGQPFIFPSLGPSAFSLAFDRRGKRTRTYRIVGSHCIGAIVGLLAYALLGSGVAITITQGAFSGSGFQLALSGMVSIALTSWGMIATDTNHPPACATTLIVSLGLLSTPIQVVTIIGAIIILVESHRLFLRGFDYFDETDILPDVAATAVSVLQPNTASEFRVMVPISNPRTERQLISVASMIANNTSGLNAVRYGVTGDHVLRLEVVLPDGRIIECGRDVPKSTAGYNLKDLFVGSEGTLGVITEATLSLEGIAQHWYAALVPFPSSVAASRAVSTIMASGLTPGALEFMDAQLVELLNDYNDDADFPVAPLLLIELHGNSGDLNTQMDRIQMICDDYEAIEWSEADTDDIETIWRTRRDAYPAACEYYPDRTVGVIGDVVVPISKNSEIVRRIEAISDELELLTPCVGHAGDGNIHFLPVVDTDDPAAMDRVQKLTDAVVSAALELGGTATGEHGIGIGKRKFMRDEHGDAVDVMSDIKDVIDPTGIMNPGKTLPRKD